MKLKENTLYKITERNDAGIANHVFLSPIMPVGKKIFITLPIIIFVIKHELDYMNMHYILYNNKLFCLFPDYYIFEEL